MGPLPTFYQANFKININETSEAEGMADHVTLLFPSSAAQKAGGPQEDREGVRAGCQSSLDARWQSACPWNR